MTHTRAQILARSNWNEILIAHTQENLLLAIVPDKCVDDLDILSIPGKGRSQDRTENVFIFLKTSPRGRVAI